MKFFYFSWIREKIGVSEEDLEPPNSLKTVSEVLGWLKGQGDNYEDALNNLSLVCVAINHNHASFNDPISSEDEVALFPPVTGGLKSKPL